MSGSIPTSATLSSSQTAHCGERGEMITEAFVTTKTIEWLKERGWGILSMDYPQSGTGFVLHPEGTKSKTEGAIIPDIVATKSGVGLIFENKDRFNLGDFN